MSIAELLQELASVVHHRSNVSELIAEQEPKVQEAFLKNNSAQLKNLLGDTKNLADRDKVTLY